MDILFFTENPNFTIATVGIIALFVGSFLNVVIYRLPKMMEKQWGQECRVYLGLKLQPETEDNLNLCLPLSHCPQCKRGIRPWHNIPIFSYIWLRGKCADCHAPISARYPLVETLTCLASIYISWRFGFSLQTLAGLIFTWICICLTFIDLDYLLLPDELTLSLLWIGLFFSLFNVFTSPPAAIIGAMLGYLLFAGIQAIFGWLTGKIGLGQGDFKLLAALGAYLGWQILPLIILFASACGILFACIHMLIKRQFKSEPLPFGPYLAIAGWLALIWGNDILRVYLHFLAG